MDFDISQDHRFAGAVDHLLGFVERRPQAARIAALMDFRWRMVGNAGNHYLIARQLDIDRTLVADRRVQHAVNFLKSSLRITEDSRSYRELLKYLLLCVEFPHFVM